MCFCVFKIHIFVLIFHNELILIERNYHGNEILSQWEFRYWQIQNFMLGMG